MRRHVNSLAVIAALAGVAGMAAEGTNYMTRDIRQSVDPHERSPEESNERLAAAQAKRETRAQRRLREREARKSK